MLRCENSVKSLGICIATCFDDCSAGSTHTSSSFFASATGVRENVACASPSAMTGAGLGLVLPLESHPAAPRHRHVLCYWHRWVDTGVKVVVGVVEGVLGKSGTDVVVVGLRDGHDSRSGSHLNDLNVLPHRRTVQRLGSAPKKHRDVSKSQQNERALTKREPDTRPREA